MAWINGTDSRVIDSWIALAIYEQQDEDKKQAPEDVLEGLNRLTGMVNGRRS